MLRDGSNQVVSVFSVESCYALNRSIVGLGCTGGKENFLRLCIDLCGHLFPRNLDGFRDLPPIKMSTGVRITKLFGKIGHHGLGHTRVHGRGRVAVEINWFLL